jgi:hypothetical protein
MAAHGCQSRRHSRLILLEPFAPIVPGRTRKSGVENLVTSVLSCTKIQANPPDVSSLCFHSA